MTNKRDFLEQQYIGEHGDLQSVYSPTDATALLTHYQQYGHKELRGVKSKSSYHHIDQAFCSDAGDIFVLGWADRRLNPEIHIRIVIGYFQYILTGASICWYERADVDKVVGSIGMRSGFMVLARLDELMPHSNIEIFINHHLAYRNECVRWLTPVAFLDQCLQAMAFLAHKDPGTSYGSGSAIIPHLTLAWHAYSKGVAFSRIISLSRARRPSFSVIIVLYRNAKMLLSQLRFFANTFQNKDVEVVIVANAVPAIEELANKLRSYHELFGIAVQLYSCPINAGFSIANNYGTEVAQSDNLIFMNPDIYPSSFRDPNADSFFVPAPKDTLVGAKLYYGNGSLMHSGMYVSKDIVADPTTGALLDLLKVEHFGKGLAESFMLEGGGDAKLAFPAAEDPAPVTNPIVSAALWNISRAAFEKNGRLSTDYIFAYYEDADFALRMLAKGGNIVLRDDVCLFHMEGVGGANTSQMATVLWHNRFIFSQKFANDSNVVSAIQDDLLI